MSMSKKVYVDFARMIRKQRHQALLLTPEESTHEKIIVLARQHQIDGFVNSLCDLFESDNPQFKAHKFIAACEIDTESK